MELDVQYVSVLGGLPTREQFERWVQAVLGHRYEKGELALRIVDTDEIKDMNLRYRGKCRPTNVLSFPFEAPPGIQTKILGDVVICAPVVRHEAREQGKTETEHWAHMVVHGVLHLQGYDHIEDDEAEVMERREIAIMRQLGFDSPYDDSADEAENPVEE